MTKKASLLVVMSGVVAAGLAFGDSADAKTLSALLLGPASQTGETYTQCFSGAQIFTVAEKTADSPAGGSLFRCEVTAFSADTWFSDSGCHSASTLHRAVVRTASTVLATSGNSLGWNLAASVNATVNSRVNGVGSCANNVITGMSFGS
jgi:hypothetical protein